MVLKALIPYLKPAGKLLASIPNGVHASIRLEILEGRLTYEDTGLLDDTHLHFYTHASLRGLLSRAGYSVEELTYTFQDVPDTIIRERLARVGIEPSDRILNLLHSPEAVAFQFIAVASPAVPDMAIEPYSELHDLPLRDSLEYTRNLLKELDETRKNLQDRNKRLEEYHHHAIALQERVQHLERTIKEHEAHSERITEAHAEQSVELKQIQDALQSEHVRVRDLEVLNDKLTEDLESQSRTLQAVLNSRGWRLWNRLILPRRIARRLTSYATFICANPALDSAPF